MMNQVEALRGAGVEARSLNSGTGTAEREGILADLKTGHPRTRLLYVTPELCAQEGFRARLRLVHEQRELARVAVDEAHCISEWGHDFRPDFKRLAWFRASFPDVPLMCLTATANPRVRRDVLSTLGLLDDNAAAGNPADSDRLRTFTMTAYRPNLHLEVRFTRDEDDRRLEDFLRWIRGVHGRRAAGARGAEVAAAGERADGVSGIIYTTSRDECEGLAAQLRREGVGARAFHARLPREAKEATLARWVAGAPGYEVVVATTAFGMGIDKRDVRFVVHWRLPKSFEGYYQEAGRAGRDGNAAYCFLYYSREDRDRVSSMVMRDHQRQNGGGGDGGSSNFEARAKSLQALAEYCENTSACRHRLVCRYFGETEVPACEYACDWHKDSADLQRRFLRGLASEEWVSTQREEGMYDVYWDD